MYVYNKTFSLMIAKCIKPYILFFSKFTLTLQEVISSESFYKAYTLSHYNFDNEEQPSGHLAAWQDPEEWFCYWDDSYADDKTADAYVFSDPPERWKCGIVHLAKYKLESDKDLRYKDFFRAVAILMRIQKAAEQLDLDCGKSSPLNSVVLKFYEYEMG